MGIYQGTNRIDSVNVGSKDMVCVMQDNHILALGKKYWAVKIKDLTWNYATSTGVGAPEVKYFHASLSLSINITGYNDINRKKISINGYSVTDTLTSSVNTTLYKNKTIAMGASGYNICIRNDSYTDTTDFTNNEGEKWIFFQFDQTLYDKVDLGSLNWNYSVGSERFYASITSLNAKAVTADTKGNLYSFILETIKWNDMLINSVDFSIAVNSNATEFNIRYSTLDDKDVFRNVMKGKTLLFEVAE